MGTAMGGAIDWFISGTTGNGDTLLTLLRAVDPQVILGDNFPDSESQSLVIIGRDSLDTSNTIDITDKYQVLGAGRLSEDFELNGFVSVYRPGPAQKTARDAAIALFDAINHFLHEDLTLGGLLLQGRHAEMSSAQLTQTQNSRDAAGGDMRTAEIQFSIHIQNHYIP